MGSPLRPGDHVRLAARNRKRGYKRGDTGHVLWGPHAPAGGRPYRVVVMDANPLGRPEVFLEEEIRAIDEESPSPLGRILSNTGMGGVHRPAGRGELKEALGVGDRVRVTASSRAANYRLGDKGTVLRAFALAKSGAFGYVVAMDRDGPGAAGTAFTEGEVERDG